MSIVFLLIFYHSNVHDFIPSSCDWSCWLFNIALSPETIVVGSSVTATLTSLTSIRSFIYLELHNEWLDNSGDCIEVEGATQVFASTPYVIKMERGPDGNYTAVFSISVAGKFTIALKEYGQENTSLVKIYYNAKLEEPIVYGDYFTFSRLEEKSIDLDSLCPDECSYQYLFYLSPLSTGDQTITFSAKSDGLFFINGEFMGISFAGNQVTKTINLDSSKLYSFEIHLFDRGGESNVQIGVEGNIHMPKYPSVSATTYEAVCLPGYSSVKTGNSISWEIVWGDGFKNEEEWDDGNTFDFDGCSSSCQIEEWFKCTGGNLTTKDEWVDWRLTGQSPSSDKTEWEDTWGDGLVGDSEKCDDGNRNSNDGCGYLWTPEFRYKWTGGSYSTPSIWEICPDGYSTNDEHTEWGKYCGDGLKHPDEEWDDGRPFPFPDGCNNSWKIDSGYICTGGTPTGKDTCRRWTDGTSPNSSKDEWIQVWGDGKRHSSEAWDDGNTNDSDGWNSSCEIGKQNLESLFSSL